MSEHQEIHRQAARALNDVEAAIDALVGLGPDPSNGNNALMHIRGRLLGLAGRTEGGCHGK
jgi:hypothetical protein